MLTMTFVHLYLELNHVFFCFTDMSRLSIPSAFSPVPFASNVSALRHLMMLRDSSTRFLEMTRREVTILVQRILRTPCTDDEFIILLDKLCAVVQESVMLSYLECVSMPRRSGMVWIEDYTKYALALARKKNNIGPFNLEIARVLSKHDCL